MARTRSHFGRHLDCMLVIAKACVNIL